MKKALTVTLLSLALSGCFTMGMHYEAEVKRGDGKTGTFSYQRSESRLWHGIACVATGVYWGGWCWAYLFMPFKSDLKRTTDLAHKSLKSKMGKQTYHLANEDVYRRGWNSGVEYALLDFGEGDAATDPAPVKPGPAKPRVWDWAVVAEPVALIFPGPSFEVQHRVSSDVGHPHSVSLAYWDQHDSTFATIGSESGNFHTSDRRVPKSSVKHVQRGLAARSKLYLTKSLHLNFGLGARTTSTEETAKFPSGVVINATKSATSVGLDLGVGSRWVFPNGIVLGGNWLEAFVPVKTVKSEDARLPAGYESTGNGASLKNDGMLATVRLAILDLGFAW